MAPLGMACGAAWHGARQAAAKANARARSVAIITARKFRDRASSFRVATVKNNVILRRSWIYRTRSGRMTLRDALVGPPRARRRHCFAAAPAPLRTSTKPRDGGRGPPAAQLINVVAATGGAHR